MVDFSHVDPGLDAGDFTFSLTIPPNFQRDVLAGKKAELQLNVDATRMSQAFSGSGYVQQIVLAEVNEFVQRHREPAHCPWTGAARPLQPGLNKIWFGGLMQIINNVTMLSIILTGGADPQSVSMAPSSICWSCP
jgi:ABC-2 type transport system permease protein